MKGTKGRLGALGKMDKSTSSAQQPRIASPHLLIFLATLGVLGGIALIVGNVVGSVVVPDHDWVSDTVSDLAAGKYEIIQDVALYGYAGSLLALGLATAHLHGGSWRWTGLMLVLVLLAVFVVIIGARNEYGDNDSEGIVIHIYIVYAMGVAFVLCFVLAALIYAEFSTWFSYLSWGAAALWIVGAPVFFMMSTAYDGAWERGLGLVSMVWTTAYALLLWRMARSGDA